MKNNEGVVKRLLEAGATVDQAREDGKTPLMMAVEKGHKAVVRVLEENGADWKKLIYMDTPLIILIASENTQR